MSADKMPAGLRPLDELEGSHIQHFFGSGVCVKETLIPRGSQIVQHRHHYPHLAYLVSGTVRVVSDNNERIMTGPDCLEIPAGAHHAVHALTGAVWLCIHRADADTPEQVDAITVAPINEPEVAAVLRKLNEGN